LNLLKAAALAAPLVLLSACAGSLQGDLYQTLYASQATLTASETVAKQYVEGSFGKPDAVVASDIKAYDAKAYNALHPLVLDAQAGESVTTMAVTTAQSYVSDFYGYLTAHNVGGIK